MIAPFRICFRTICSTNTLHKKMWNTTGKQAVMLDKMLRNVLSRKNAGPRPSGLLSKGNLTSPYENINTTKRMVALNKIYMESIIPLLYSGTCGGMLSDLGIEVSKVEISSDLNYLNVFWITRKLDTPAAVLESVLNKALRELQENIGSMRFYSKIPHIRFVKDERLEREIELEKIFEKADYGEDYVPVYERKVFTQTSVPGSEALPKMRENVLGLDHGKIKGKIMAKIFRFKAISTEKVENEDESKNESGFKHETPEKLIPFRKKEFFKFYKMRRIMALKRLKRGEYDF